MKTTTSTQSTADTKGIILMAAWFGLLTGLVEGIGLWILQRLGWLASVASYLGISIEIVWIAAIFDLILFGAVGLGLNVVAQLVPRLPAMRLSFFLFASLACFDWLALLLIGRIHKAVVPLLAIGLAVEFTRWFGKNRDSFMRSCRRSAPWLAALALLALVGIQGGFWLQERMAVARLPNATPGTPNILVIVVDTLRADHLSSYGYSRPTSPNLDSIAEQGVLFEHAFATSSWTKPSHASLVTGRYTYQHGADATEQLDDRYPTIAEVLQSHGYRTGAFSANYWVFNRHEGFGRGFVHFEDFYRSISNMATNTLYGRVIEEYVLHRGLGLRLRVDRRRASDINRSLLHWIDRDSATPFFAFLNYYDPHAPYVPPQPYRSMFSQLEEPGGLINTDWDMQHIYVPMTPEQLQGEIDAYDGTVAYVDNHIGELMAELQERGLAKNTLVVVTSDHGELFGEHGLFEHTNSLYREVIQVPLIFWWPGHVPAGKRVAEPVSNVALPATLLDLIAGDEPTSFPGPSLTQLWQDASDHVDWPYPIAEVAQIPWVPVQHLTAHGAMRSDLSTQWHYIEHDKLPAEFYDWKADPQELHDVAQSPEVQGDLERLRVYLRNLLASAE